MRYRLLLKEDVFLPDLLSDISFAIECAAGREGVTYLGICYRHESTVGRSWRSDPPGAFTVDLIEDRNLSAAWLAVQAKSEALAAALADALCENLPMESPEELRRRAAAPDSAFGSLQRLALALNSEQPGEARDLALFKAALEAKERERRMDAIMGATLWRSPALAPLLTDAQAREGDPALRQALDYAVKRLACPG